MRSKLLLLLVLIYCLPTHSYSQTANSCSTVTFQKEILLEIGTGYDYMRRPNQLLETLDSNIVTSGRLIYWPESDPSVIRDDSGYVAKLDKEGNAIWYKTFLDSSWGSTRIFQLPDSNFILYGTTDNELMTALFITKLDKQGNFLWQKKHRSTLGIINWVGDMNVVSDGGMIATGIGDAGLLISKFDSEGNLLWYKDYEHAVVNGGFNASNFFNRNSLAETPDGYIVAQLYFSGNSNQVETPAYMLKVNKLTGDVIWSKKINEASRRIHMWGLIKNSNSITLGLSTNQTTNLEKGFSFIKIDYDGNLLNNVNLPRPFPSFAFNKLNDGIIAVLSDTSLDTNTPYAMFQLNKDFTIDWAKKYIIDIDQSGVNQSRPVVIQCKDSNVYAIFTRKKAPALATNSYFLKTDKTGNAGDCESINFNIPLKKPQVTITDVPVVVVDYPLLTTTGILQMTSKPVYSNTICTQVTYCDQIDLIGPSQICSFTDSIGYVVSRNGACFTSPVWKLADTSYGSITVYSDTSIKIKFNKAGEVKLYATIPTNCGEIRDSLLINISRPAASLNIGHDFGFCGDSSFILQAGNGFVDYQWQDGTVDQNYSSSSPGLYYVTVRDACNDSFRDSILIAAIAPEDIQLDEELFICKNDSITITAANGFINYQWSPTYNIINSSTQTATFFPYFDTKYYLHATKRPGCISIDSTIIHVNNPTEINLPGDSSICQGQSITLNAGNNFESYQWSTGQSSAQITVNAAGLYIISAKDINGCISQDSFRLINLRPNPTLNINKDTHLCKGQPRIIVAGNNPNYRWLWQDGSNASQFTVTDTGFYKVIVTDFTNGCASADSVHVNHLKLSPFNFLPADSAMCLGQPLAVSSLRDFSTYSWSNGSGSKSISVSQPGIYKLQVIDNYDCKGLDSIKIHLKDCRKIIYFPSAFTPNGDGLNDIFRASFSLLPEKFNLKIYNRYGEIIYTSNDPLSGWDGSYKGQQQNSGSFVWIAEYQFNGEKMQQQKASILLIR